MDILPEPLLNYIGSFLDAKDCASCRLASPKLSQICYGVKDFVFAIANAEAGQHLAQKLKSISSVFPCLKRCKIYCSRILNAQGAERSITMPGVEIELVFDKCIEDAVDTMIGWFSEVPKVSLNWSTITGSEPFLRHRIFSLNTYINKENANLFKAGPVCKIPNLSIRINTAYLDLSGIDTSCNKELVLCLGPQNITTCLSAWKITQIVLDCNSCWEAYESVAKSMHANRSVKYPRLYQVIFFDYTLQQLGLNLIHPTAYMLPQNVRWLIKPMPQGTLVLINQLRAAGRSSIFYLAANTDTHINTLLYRSVFKEKYDVYTSEKYNIDSIKPKSVQDLFHGMSPLNRMAWHAVENLLTPDQFMISVCP